MLEKKLATPIDRYKELEKLLSDPVIISDREKFQSYSKELGDLKGIYEKGQAYLKVFQEIKETKALLNDSEMQEMAKIELEKLEAKEAQLAKKIKILLLPKDPFDDKNIIMEIRAGTGGEEAALFAGELLRMYLRFAERSGWKTEIISSSPTGLGGYKEVTFNLIGHGAYSRLKYEGGTHRVQRVPATESNGRVHTSAATVVVMPEAEDVDVKIDQSDLRVDTYRAGGPGGQNVNKVSSAIRITHLPTGLVVACQEERSQLQNRVKAMKLLKTKLLEQAEEKARKERSETRKIMVGTGDRSEKIRTYNFPQGRITDHRIGFTIYRLNDFLDGDINEAIEALIDADRAAKLKKL
ncbi:peptide chain release factor 1 [Candidatus Saganbacteria bacterium CG08_land_8_20_14_0_20_45_16]|uniref:Peptide chain release factor 1 n=1 Tax=Candidatus Saganbacteria bacterium CG08_land_8_20_14_0_20_45_16 TaxID=2014293 RepID=A0A2H0Y1Y7_UNCSA|nr:MAG: peptide chain release factor 1 [Candidatus Saganbacteria bacterium CG08_land_8_20_14_0_20_45_16]